MSSSAYFDPLGWTSVICATKMFLEVEMGFPSSELAQTVAGAPETTARTSPAGIAPCSAKPPAMRGGEGAVHKFFGIAGILAEAAGKGHQPGLVLGLKPPCAAFTVLP